MVCINDDSSVTSVPRYRLVGYDIGTAPDANGGWVHWTDYARLRTELEEARAAEEGAHMIIATERAEVAQLRRRVAELEAEIARLTAERGAAILAKDCFQRMTRAHWEALCAMRNSINEYIPMPNTDSGPLFSPEDGPIYADIAERVIADLTENRAYALALEQELRDRAALQPDPDARQADLAKAYGPILDLLPDAVRAAEKAMRKYPQPNYVISKWSEETGEVTKDLIHMAEGRQTADKLCGEIVQSLAMLHRLMVEGDQVHGLPPVGPAIRALTPPADLAAKIGGE